MALSFDLVEQGLEFLHLVGIFLGKVAFLADVVGEIVKLNIRTSAVESATGSASMGGGFARDVFPLADADSLALDAITLDDEMVTWRFST